MERVTTRRGLSTVCTEARCPNRGECFGRGTATFMINGDRCTRDCRFCAVDHGEPRPLNPQEPVLVGETVKELGLRHAVITSVTRDDLADGGASLFAETVNAVRALTPGVTVEVLIPDFQGNEVALQTVVNAHPDVINHNMETVRRLYPVLRSAASYDRSLRLLGTVASEAPDILVKTGIMAGVGETREELRELFEDLVRVGCRSITIGQYLRPTAHHHPVDRFLPPEEFEDLKHLAASLGMRDIASGPLVRSSYRAEQFLADNRCRGERGE